MRTMRLGIIVATISYIGLLPVHGAVTVGGVPDANNANLQLWLDADDLSEWMEDYSVGELWQKNVVRGGPTSE